MTAKEKAIEVIKKFRAELLFETFPDSLDTLSKECAINHVECIIEEHERYFSNEYFKERLEYWQQVLTELNQM